MVKYISPRFYPDVLRLPADLTGYAIPRGIVAVHPDTANLPDDEVMLIHKCAHCDFHVRAKGPDFWPTMASVGLIMVTHIEEMHPDHS